MRCMNCWPSSCLCLPAFFLAIPFLQSALKCETILPQRSLGFHRQKSGNDLPPQPFLIDATLNRLPNSAFKPLIFSVLHTKHEIWHGFRLAQCKREFRWQKANNNALSIKQEERL